MDAYIVSPTHMKSVLPEDAWTKLTGASNVPADKLWRKVAWLYRGVDLRGKAISQVPYEIRGPRSLVYDSTSPANLRADLQWLARLPHYLALAEQSICLYGAAYFEKRYSVAGNLLSLDYLVATTMKPAFVNGELNHFIRTIDGKESRVEKEHIIYLWLPDPTVEQGPASSYPVKAAMSSAAVLKHLDDFLASYFESGLQRAYLLKNKGSSQLTGEKGKEQATTIKNWFNNLVKGKRGRFETLIVDGGIEVETIGDGLEGLSESNLTTEMREDISAALGVPQSKLFKKPGGLGDSQESDNKTFYEDTILPECAWIEAALNEQLFGPGLTLVFTPQKMALFQRDEVERAASFKTLVEAGIPLETAAAMVGLDVPAGMPLTAEKRDEIAKFRRWARNRANPNPEDFDSDILTLEEKQRIINTGL